MNIRITLSDGKIKRVYVTDPNVTPPVTVTELKKIALIHLLDSEGELCREFGVSDESGVFPAVDLVLLPEGIDTKVHSMKMQYQIIINGFTYSSNWSEPISLIEEEIK